MDQSVKIIIYHKTLIKIFDSVKKVSDSLSLKMLRQLLMLAGYDYTIEYRKAKNIKIFMH